MKSDKMPPKPIPPKSRLVCDFCNESIIVKGNRSNQCLLCRLIAGRKKLKG